MTVPPTPPTSYSGVMQPSRPLYSDQTPHYWWSDREIGEGQPSSIGYSSADFRQELGRVERKVYWLTVGSIAVAIVAVLSILGILSQVLV